ncbi:MAG TPA: hypothetical protein PKM19_10025 [Pseudomonadales bacterium]|nr:hypothetical protein [Pseudomonadales bacterium]
MKRVNYIVISLLAFLSVGCASHSPSANRPAVTWTKSVATAEEQSTAKAAVINQLKDPESARFGEIWAMDGTNGRRHICGYVNAKNGYGGYTGMKVFNLSNNVVLVDGSGSLGALVPSICTPRTVK